MNEETVSTCGSLFDPLPVVWSRQEVLYPGGGETVWSTAHGLWVRAQNSGSSSDHGSSVLRFHDQRMFSASSVSASIPTSSILPMRGPFSRVLHNEYPPRS